MATIPRISGDDIKKEVEIALEKLNKIAVEPALLESTLKKVRIDGLSSLIDGAITRDRTHELSREQFKQMVRDEVAQALLAAGGINMAALEARMKDFVTQTLNDQADGLKIHIREKIEELKNEFMNELRKL